MGMAVGGLSNTKRIAKNWEKATPMSHEQNFATNLTTGFIVIIANRTKVASFNYTLFGWLSIQYWLDNIKSDKGAF